MGKEGDGRLKDGLSGALFFFFPFSRHDFPRRMKKIDRGRLYSGWTGNDNKIRPE
jgi:hypothetical protein